MLKTVITLPLLLAVSLAAGATARAEPEAACTAYCQITETNAGKSGQICYLNGENGMSATLTQHCLNLPTASLPIPLPEDLQQRLLEGKVNNPFREQYPVAEGVSTPVIDHDTVSGLQALPLQLDDDDRTEEWLVYQTSPEGAAPPYFWVIQFQGKGIYRIMLEHAGQMFWEETDKADNYHQLRTARFAELDEGGKSGSFTDVREWQFTSGFYSLLATTGMAAGPVEQPEPMM